MAVKAPHSGSMFDSLWAAKSNQMKCASMKEPKIRPWTT